MGVFKKNCYMNPTAPEAVQPDPSRFKVSLVCPIGSLWVARIRYANCSNYEGEKILVLRKDPRKLTRLDPHFTPGGIVFARFEPTKLGLETAILVARSVNAAE